MRRLHRPNLRKVLRHDHGSLRSDRAAAGLAATTICVVIALSPGGLAVMTVLLLVVGGIIGICALAPGLPGLNKLWIVGAPHVTIALTWEHLRGSEVEAHGAAILRVGIDNEGPGELRRPRVNVLAPLPADIEASDAAGMENQRYRGERMPNTSEQIRPGIDSAFFAERLPDIDAGDALIAHYRVRVGGDAGPLPVRVKVLSSSLYGTERVVETTLEVVGRD